MLTVGYDVTSLAQNRYGGIATVCRHTLLQAASTTAIHAAALYRRGDRANLGDCGVAVRRIAWWDRFAPGRYDILHALGHRVAPLRHRRLVYTLHDAWSLYPNRYQSPGFQARIGARMVRELQRADAIICDSRATLEALETLSLADPSRCHVVYPGVVEPAVPDSTESSGIRGVSEPDYVLFVGRIEVRKNLEHLVEAVRPIVNLHLIIVGEHGYGGEEIAARALSRMPSERLHVLARVGDRELSRLYRGAIATLQPSWEEGFGLPMLEAMAHGCPLITSNCSASAEIAGDAAILVDPAIPDQSRVALQKLAEDLSARREWSEKGQNRSRQFTWQTYFQALVTVYERLS